MNNLLLSTIIFGLCAVYSGSKEIDKCTQKGPCRCLINELEEINLSNLTQPDPNKPFLQDTKGNFTFFYHGCEDGNFSLAAFNIPTNTSNQILHGSLIMLNTTYITKTTSNVNFTNTTMVPIYELTVIGKSNHTVFQVFQKKTYRILYKDGENISATIDLVCEDYDTPYIKIIGDPTSKQLTLNSPQACLIIDEQGLSGGTIVLILFFTAVFVYLIGGMLVTYFMRGARGIEIIPNIDFWKKLPGLVKDGSIFILSGCSPHYVSAVDTYDRI